MLNILGSFNGARIKGKYFNISVVKANLRLIHLWAVEEV